MASASPLLSRGIAQVSPWYSSCRGVVALQARMLGGGVSHPIFSHSGAKSHIAVVGGMAEMVFRQHATRSN